MTTWSTLKEIIIIWTWDMVAGKENVITIYITRTWILSTLACICVFHTHTFVCVQACMCCLHQVLKCRNTLQWQSHYCHVRLTFWLHSGSISKVIILWLPPYYLPTKVSLQHNFQISHPGLSGGWAFDWQLVNDVISILLGKWSSSDSRLVGERGR